MEEFLRYSMAHGRRIKAIMLLDGHIAQQNITILDYSLQEFTYISAKQKSPRTLPLQCLLSLGYARGDTGEME